MDQDKSRRIPQPEDGDFSRLDIQVKPSKQRDAWRATTKVFGAVFVQYGDTIGGALAALADDIQQNVHH